MRRIGLRRMDEKSHSTLHQATPTKKTLSSRQLESLFHVLLDGRISAPRIICPFYVGCQFFTKAFVYHCGANKQQKTCESFMKASA